MKKFFLAWKPFCARSHNLAQHFNAQIVYIHPFSSDGKPLLAVLRYFISFFITLNTLFRKKPKVVFTLNQPIILLFAVYIYSRATGACYILDSHSAPFNNPILTFLRPLYKFFAIHAAININTNQAHQKLVESWGGKSFVIGDVPIDFIGPYPAKKLNSDSIAVVVSYMFDEPIEEIFDAARLLPDVTFYMTGNYKKAKRELLQKAPDNIQFQGYMEREDYLGLLISARGVMALTTRDYTMQMGAYEALSLERPIITSDWQILRNSFGPAALYTNNRPESIKRCVNELIKNTEKYLAAAHLQKKMRRKYFEQVKTDIEKESRTFAQS
jgi:glycosyltransferase involved in cell wall biosynthesis